MKKFLSIAIMLSLALSLCACNFRIPMWDKPNGPSNEANPSADHSGEAPEETSLSTSEELVTTVIDYSREIVSQGGTTYLTHHTIKCPALTAETEDAKAINESIYAIYSAAVNTLESGDEGEYIYHMGFDSFVYNGVVALVLEMSISNHYGGVFPAYDVYYYDSAAGRQLTYQQYWDALGITIEQLRQVMNSDSWLSTISYDILWAAADGEETAIMARSPDFMDDTCLFVFEESILN